MARFIPRVIKALSIIKSLSRKEVKMNSLSTHLVKLDIQTILAHFKEPKFWAKKWLISSIKIWKYHGVLNG